MTKLGMLSVLFAVGGAVVGAVAVWAGLLLVNRVLGAVHDEPPRRDW